MNGTSAVAFVSAMSTAFGYAHLSQGLQLAAATTNTSEDLANGFAKTYDETMTALPAGTLVGRPAENATKRVTTLVTRVSKAPFLALVILDLLYASVGIVLTIIALVALSSGSGVRDAQARLSVAAVVAECFENPALGHDATHVDELYAERRGFATRRVAIGRRVGGGRRYRPIVTRAQEYRSILPSHV